MMDSTMTQSTTAVTETGTPASVEVQLEIARRRIAELEEEVRLARIEPVTSGGDPRLEGFWQEAGEMADELNFCEEYDRLAEQLGGPVRLREWEVSFHVTLSLTVNVAAKGRDEDDAADDAIELLTRERILEELRDDPYFDFDRTINNIERQ